MRCVDGGVSNMSQANQGLIRNTLKTTGFFSGIYKVSINLIGLNLTNKICVFNSRFA